MSHKTVTISHQTLKQRHWAVRAAGEFFSIAVQMNPHVAAAITAIGEADLAAHLLSRASWDDQLGCWASDAEVCENLANRVYPEERAGHHRPADRPPVRDLSKRASGQGELFAAWRYHTAFTDSPFTMFQAVE